MDLKLAQAMQEAMTDCGYSCEIREGYSGRGMYGGETTGIVIDNITQLLESLIEAAYVLVDEDEGPIFDVTGDIRTDSMGLSMIVY